MEKNSRGVDEGSAGELHRFLLCREECAENEVNSVSPITSTGKGKILGRGELVKGLKGRTRQTHIWEKALVASACSLPRHIPQYQLLHFSIRRLVFFSNLVHLILHVFNSTSLQTDSMILLAYIIYLLSILYK